MRRGGVAVGIDPGSAVCGLCAVEPDGSSLRLIALQTLKLHGTDRFRRFRDLSLRLGEALRRLKPSIVAVESAVVCGYARATLVVSEARGIALAEAAKVTDQIHEVPVQSARKALGVAGFAQQREEGKIAVRRVISHLFKTQYAPSEDEADAAALAVWAANRIDRGDCSQSEQREG